MAMMMPLVVEGSAAATGLYLFLRDRRDKVDQLVFHLLHTKEEEEKDHADYFPSKMDVAMWCFKWICLMGCDWVSLGGGIT